MTGRDDDRHVRAPLDAQAEPVEGGGRGVRVPEVQAEEGVPEPADPDGAVAGKGQAPVTAATPWGARNDAQPEQVMAAFHSMPTKLLLELSNASRYGSEHVAEVLQRLEAAIRAKPGVRPDVEGITRAVLDRPAG